MFIPFWLLVAIIVMCSVGSASSRSASDGLKVERDYRTADERAADARKARVAFLDQILFWGLMVAAAYIYFHH